jgi:hypothetical protein
MICARCKRDFKEDENRRGFYTNQSDHFGRPYRIFGYTCSNCGFNNTVISIPIQIPFIRESRTYDRLDSIVEDFREKVEEFYKTKSKYKIQLDLYESESDSK